jgi:hypothetical protein
MISFGVRRIQCIRNLDFRLQHFRKRQRLAGNVVLERLAVEKFHRNEGLTIVFADFVDDADVRMGPCLSNSGEQVRVAVPTKFHPDIPRCNHP